MDNRVRAVFAQGVVAEGLGDFEMRGECAVHLAAVCEVGAEGVDEGFWGDVCGERGEVDVEDFMATGEEVGYYVLAGFAGAAGYDDSFAHCAFCVELRRVRVVCCDFLG